MKVPPTLIVIWCTIMSCSVSQADVAFQPQTSKRQFLFEQANGSLQWPHFKLDRSTVHILVLNQREMFIFFQNAVELIICLAPTGNLIALQFIVFDSLAQCAPFNYTRWNLEHYYDGTEAIASVYPAHNGQQIVLTFFNQKKCLVIDLERQTCLHSTRRNYFTNAMNGTALLVDGVKRFYSLSPKTNCMLNGLAVLCTAVSHVELWQEQAKQVDIGQLFLGKESIRQIEVVAEKTETTALSGTKWLPLLWSDGISGFEREEVLYLFAPNSTVLICPLKVLNNQAAWCFKKAFASFFIIFNETKFEDLSQKIWSDESTLNKTQMESNIQRLTAKLVGQQTSELNTSQFLDAWYRDRWRSDKGSRLSNSTLVENWSHLKIFNVTLIISAVLIFILVALWKFL